MAGISRLFATAILSGDIADLNTDLLAGTIKGYKVPDGIVSAEILNGIVDCLNHNNEGANISTISSNDGGTIVHSIT